MRRYSEKEMEFSKEFGKCKSITYSDNTMIILRDGLSYKQALEIIEKYSFNYDEVHNALHRSTGMRLPNWNSYSNVKYNHPVEYEDYMTDSYLYIETPEHRIPWHPHPSQQSSNKWQIVNVREWINYTRDSWSDSECEMYEKMRKKV
jgi:hypothetical protein